MTDQQHDIIVIGLGPGGEEVGGRLAEAGLRVLGVEAELVGGECPYWGCVPSKMIIRAANTLAEARRIDGVAGHGEATPDWSPVARRIRAEATDNWDDRVAVERFEGKGGTFLRGRARIVAADAVEVDGTRHTATRALVIATGTHAAVPPVRGLDSVPFWTNRDVMRMEQLPASLLVLGGGAVGIELAQALARFGVTVTVIEAAPHLVPLEEPEAGAALEAVLAAEGIAVHTAAAAEQVGAGAGGVEVRLRDGRTLSAERLLIATGRRADLRGLGVAAAGLDEQARFVDVDERMRCGERVWAVGDITGRGLFTHVAIWQARIAAADILGENLVPADYRALPRVTFTDPEVGAAGITEAQARERGIAVRTGVKKVSSTARGWIHGPGNDGVIKLVEDADRGVLVGATAMGPSGGEVIGMLALAIAEQIPTQRLRAMIYAYPTFHRGIEDALGELAR